MPRRRRRAGNLPPKTSDTPLQGSQGWLCTFADPANAVTVHLDVEVNTVQRQRTGFDAQTSSAGYLPDPAIHLGERARNATFKVGIDDRKAPADGTQICKAKVKAIAQALYDTMQPG